MDQLIANPSVPESFLERPETDQIINSVHADKPLIISGLRGAGKRTLVKSAITRMDSKRIRAFEVDLYKTSSLSEMIITLARQTLGKLDTNHLKLMRELSNYFTHLRPVIEYDAVTGAVVMNFNLDPAFKPSHTLEQIFTYLNRLNTPVFLAFEEYQQILEYRETHAEQLVRELIPSFNNIHFVLTCTPSVQWNQLLKEDNGNAYTRMDHLALQPAEHDTWKKFIMNRFAESKRNVSDAVTDQLLDWCRLHTYAVVTVCNHLYAGGIKQPDEWQLERLLQEMLSEKDEVFYTYRRLLTLNQWLLLKGIAKEKGAKQVMGAAFVKKHDLGSASSVQTALLALYDKEMVYEEEGRLYHTDVLFSRWLETNSL